MEEIKNYIGIVRKDIESPIGLDIQFLVKTYDDLETMYEWIKLYPNCEYIVLPNNNTLDNMFYEFYDSTPITEEEKEEFEKAKILYKRLMDED